MRTVMVMSPTVALETFAAGDTTAAARRRCLIACDDDFCLAVARTRQTQEKMRNGGTELLFTLCMASPAWLAGFG